jgi:phosphatidyl-myo-inositol dimannoside synthase
MKFPQNRPFTPSTTTPSRFHTASFTSRNSSRATALRAEFEALANDLGAGDSVKFLGTITDAAFDAAYARATVFALTSSKEGFGIVYLEAWQHGLPVICSSKGAPKEIVADGVDDFVVDPEDISMLADRLNLLLCRPELAKAMGDSGRQKVEANYLDPVFQQKLGRLIDELRAKPEQGTIAGDLIFEGPVRGRAVAARY